MTAWLPEMLQQVEVELQRYERIINYWPKYALALQDTVSPVLRADMAAVVQAGTVAPARQALGSLNGFTNAPARYDVILLVRCDLCWSPNRLLAHAWVCVSKCVLSY